MVTFIVGFILGGVFGLLMACVLIAGGNDRDDMD